METYIVALDLRNLVCQTRTHVQGVGFLRRFSTRFLNVNTLEKSGTTPQR